MKKVLISFWGFFILITNIYSQYYITHKYRTPADNYIPLNTAVTVVAEGYTEPGNEAYIKYTMDGWQTIQFAYMTCDWQGTYGIYTGVIPAQTSYKKVEYGVIINSDNTPEDGSQLAYDFNNGANYKFTITNFGGSGGTVTVNLTQPDGGETVQGNSYQILWTATESQGASSYILNDLYYSSDGGVTWTIIQSNYNNSGVYYWDTTTLPDGNNYKVKIYSYYNDETDTDSSASVFTIDNSQTGTVDINIINPDGGETISGIYQIKWSASESLGYSSEITNNIYWSTNNGINWNTIVNNFSGTYSGGYFTYNWNTQTVPNNNNFKIKIYSWYKSETATDISSSYFKITNTLNTPYLVVTPVNGKTNVAMYSNFQIEVSIASNSIFNLFAVNIGFELSRNNVQFVGLEIETNNSEFLFNNVSGTKRPIEYLTKSYINGDDKVVVNFGISFLATNGNFQDATTSGAGKIARLIFQAGDTPGECNFTFYNQAFLNNVIDTNYFPQDIIPTPLTPPAPQFKINVIGNAPPALTILYPEGGETLSGTKFIRWDASDEDNDNFWIDIYLTDINGVTITNLAYALSEYTTMFAFDTTKFPDGNYKIKIVATDNFHQLNPTIETTPTFTIANDKTPPVITYTYPLIKPDSIVLPDFGYSISTNNGIIIKFSKKMDKTAITNSFKLVNTSTSAEITNGTFRWSDDWTLIYNLPAGINLDSNSSYKLFIDCDKLLDIYGLSVSPNTSSGNYFEINFKTVIVTNIGGTVNSSDGKVTARIPPESVQKNIFLKISTEKFKGTISDNLSCIGDIYKFDIFGDSNNDGKIDENDTNPFLYGENFDGLIELKFDYIDNDEDGVVDNTRIDVNTLRVYRLNEINNIWEKVDDGGRNMVEKSDKLVIAEVKHFSYYGVFGEDVKFSVSSVEVFPNPIDFSKKEYIKFKKLPENVIIKIYDITGNIVNTLIPTGAKTDFYWDGKDRFGNFVSPGIYIYVIRTDTDKKIGKIGVIK